MFQKIHCKLNVRPIKTTIYFIFVSKENMINLFTVLGTVTDTGTNGITYLSTQLLKYCPANFYLFKIINRNTEKRCE